MTLEQRLKKIEKTTQVGEDVIDEINITVVSPESIKNIDKFKSNNDAYIRNHPDEFKEIKIKCQT